jgi:hypothetical protein
MQEEAELADADVLDVDVLPELLLDRLFRPELRQLK